MCIHLTIGRIVVIARTAVLHVICLACVLCIFCASTVAGQTNESIVSKGIDSGSPSATIGVFVEVGGYGPNVVSANADFSITVNSDSNYSQLGMRVGYAISFYNYRTLPLLITGSYGKSHRLELGAGVVANPFGVPLEYGKPAFDLSQTAFKIGAHTGWRFQQADGGWLIRGTITGMYDTGNERFFPFFGVSVGYCVGY